MKGVQIVYSKKELLFIEEGRPLPRKELHKLFCEAFKRDVSLPNLNALCKRMGWMTGRTGCYEKGNIPHPDAGAKGPNKTTFKEGSRPHNWRPVGSTRLSKDGYIEVKTDEPKKWMNLHVVNWEAENGKVPDGFCVSLLDGDKENTDIGNLELISRNESLQINQLQCLSSEEARPTVRAIGKLIAKTLDVQKNITNK